MRRLAAMALLAALPAHAAGPGPVCRDPSVVEEMARQLVTMNPYSRVDPRLVTEQPTADTRVVRCQVCVLSAPYVGDRPVGQCLAHAFDVHIVQRGFVVSDPR